MLPTITPEKIDLPPGTLIHFPGTLSDYELLLAQLGDRAATRVRFRDNYIFIMSPLPEHGKETDVIVDLIKALLRHQKLDWESFHPITLRYARQSGLEPDACFYIQNYRAILGKRRLDLSIDPPPDLAIEIDVTSFTNIEDYISLAIPEVWIYKTGVLHIYLFNSDRYLDALPSAPDGHAGSHRYIETETSQIFPDFAVKQIIPQYVDRAWQIGSSVAIREFTEQELKAN